MVNLRPKSKARAASKIKPRIPTLSTASDDPNLSEAALRKLPRSELQKLAMAHKVKANIKSELIIRQLSSLQIPKKTRPAEGDPEEGPSRKKFKGEAAPEKVSNSPENRVAVSPDAQTSQDILHTSAKDPQLPEAGPSAPRSISSEQKTPTKLSYDKTLFSRTESEMTEEEQLDYATPISSREETPPPANVNDLKRCVTIMQEISAQDVALLTKVTDVRETATKLRKKARDIRDLVKAESGRRGRMETYFRYWQEIDPNWDRQWIYGEEVPDDRDSNKFAEALTIPNDPGVQQSATAVTERKPVLSPEELRQKRQAIVAKQEAERHQLEALWRAEMRGEVFSERSSKAAGEHSLGGTDFPPTGENDAQVNATLPVESFEKGMGANMIPPPSP